MEGVVLLGIVPFILWQRGTHTVNVYDLFLTLAHVSTRMQFSTKNSKNDKSSDTHFASKFNGAWWYNNCHDSNLNGIYYGGPSDSFADGVCWTQFKGLYYSLKRTEIKLRLRIMKK